MVTYSSAVPSPDTNIQIQHYDGPVYLGNTPQNCCPFCNSILKPQTEGKTNFETPEIVYPQPVYTQENEPFEITISLDPKDDVSGSDNNNLAFGKVNLGIPKETGVLHTDHFKSIHNIPVTCKTGYGNTFPGAGISPFGSDMFGHSKPLSNYLPINTATQNTCQVPILTCNGNSDETVLVPQKFMYSLILDGEVGSNQNACDSRLYYF